MTGVQTCALPICRAKHLGLDVATMAGALAASGASSPAAVFATLLETYRARQGRDRVLEKSPVHLRHIDELMAWFPHARVLWIVRDGRACVASLLQVDWASKDPLTLARQWRRNMHFALDAERRWGHRMLRVSYEDLTADPARALAPVFTHLALPPDPRVFDHRIPVDTISPFERAWKDQVNRPLDGGRRDAWQQTLSPAVQARIAPVLNPLLHTLGYATSPATGAGRAAQWLERLRERSLFHPVGLCGLRTAHRWRALLHEHWRLQAG